MNGRFTSYSQLFFSSGTKTPGHSLKKFNTHDHFVKFDTCVSKVTHTVNAASLAHV